jgi:hypothetical protein
MIIHKRVIIWKCVKHWLGLPGRINPENITNADVVMLKALLNQVAIAYYWLSLLNKFSPRNTYQGLHGQWQQIDLLDLH